MYMCVHQTSASSCHERGSRVQNCVSLADNKHDPAMCASHGWCYQAWVVSSHACDSRQWPCFAKCHKSVLKREE